MPTATAEIWLPYRSHARAFFYLTASLVHLAVFTWLLGSEIVPIVSGSLAVTPAVIWIMLALLAGRYEREATTLVAGTHLLAWDYTSSEWARYLKVEAPRGRGLVPILAGCFALAGIGVGAGMAEGGHRIAASPLLTWMVPIGAGAALGAAVGLVIRAHRSQTFAKLADLPGRFRLGADGMYLTGSFWPWSGFGVALTEATFTATDGPHGPAMRFLFRVSRGGVQTVTVPVPEASRDAARAFAEALAQP